MDQIQQNDLKMDSNQTKINKKKKKNQEEKL